MQKYSAIVQDVQIQARNVPDINGAYYLASDVDARIAELVRVIRYWIPDETMIPKGHEVAWHEHMDSVGRYL